MHVSFVTEHVCGEPGRSMCSSINLEGASMGTIHSNCHCHPPYACIYDDGCALASLRSRETWIHCIPFHSLPSPIYLYSHHLTSLFAFIRVSHGIRSHHRVVEVWLLGQAPHFHAMFQYCHLLRHTPMSNLLSSYQMFVLFSALVLVGWWNILISIPKIWRKPHNFSSLLCFDLVTSNFFHY